MGPVSCQIQKIIEGVTLEATMLEAINAKKLARNVFKIELMSSHHGRKTSRFFND